MIDRATANNLFLDKIVHMNDIYKAVESKILSAIKDGMGRVDISYNSYSEPQMLLLMEKLRELKYDVWMYRSREYDTMLTICWERRTILKRFEDFINSVSSGCDV